MLRFWFIIMLVSLVVGCASENPGTTGKPGKPLKPTAAEAAQQLNK